MTFKQQLTIDHIEYDAPNAWERDFFIRVTFIDYWGNGPWAANLGYPFARLYQDYPCHVVRTRAGVAVVYTTQQPSKYRC